MPHSWQRSSVCWALTAGKPNVDAEEGILRGVAVATKGPALGHDMELDSEFLDSLVMAGNLKSAGIKSRFDHPNASSTSMGSFLGRTKNFRREGDVVRADLHLSDAAKHSPQGDLHHYTLKLANDEPDMFGMSIVFSGTSVEQLDADGNPIEGAPKLARLEKFLASDVVDDPAANPDGVFSSEESLAAKLTGFLDRYFDTKGIIVMRKEKQLMSNETTEKPLDVEAIRLTAQTEERQRIAEIMSVMQPGQESLAQSMIEAGTSADEACRRFLSDLKSRRADRLTVLLDAAPVSAGGGTDSAPVPELDHLTGEAKYTAEWQRDKALQKEFAAVSTYIAYRKNEDAGRVKVYQSKVLADAAR